MLGRRKRGESPPPIIADLTPRQHEDYKVLRTPNKDGVVQVGEKFAVKLAQAATRLKQREIFVVDSQIQSEPSGEDPKNTL